MQKLIILRGAPSSGKSTLAKELRNFKQKITWLKVDMFKTIFAEEASPALKYVNQSAIAVLEYLLSQGFSVVMEGMFLDPKYISYAVQVADKHLVESEIYQLECSLSELQTRDQNRSSVRGGYRQPLGDQVVERIYKIINDRPYDGAIKLDTEQLSVDECLQILQKELENKLN